MSSMRSARGTRWGLTKCLSLVLEFPRGRKCIYVSLQSIKLNKDESRFSIFSSCLLICLYVSDKAGGLVQFRLASCGQDSLLKIWLVSQNFSIGKGSLAPCTLEWHKNEAPSISPLPLLVDFSIFLLKQLDEVWGTFQLSGNACPSHTYWPKQTRPNPFRCCLYHSCSVTAEGCFLVSVENGCFT